MCEDVCVRLPKRLTQGAVSLGGGRGGLETLPDMVHMNVHDVPSCMKPVNLFVVAGDCIIIIPARGPSCDNTAPHEAWLKGILYVWLPTNHAASECMVLKHYENVIHDCVPVPYSEDKLS